MPAEFLLRRPHWFPDDLGRSDFIHVTDQYVNAHSSHRYTNGTNYAVPGYTPSAGAGKPFTDQDLAILAYYLAAQTGGFGFNHIYHLFLTPGQDVCFDSTFSVCYSPDNNNTWFFCAYHGAVSDDAGNIALYSVEPFQNVSGCSVRPDGPNGQLADSTNNVLSHEEIETITDPFGDAWWNQLDLALLARRSRTSARSCCLRPPTCFSIPAWCVSTTINMPCNPNTVISGMRVVRAVIDEAGSQANSRSSPGGIQIPWGFVIFNSRWG